MSPADPSKQERVEEFLRKSLLGEELINTQFHLFSTRSTPSSRVAKPRVLCANNILLAKSSKYFLDLLSSDINPSESSLSDLTDDNDIPNNISTEDYGYASDSDLDDENDDDLKLSVPIAEAEVLKDQLATVSTSPLKISVTTQTRDDEELSEDGSESVSSDMFVMSPEHPRMDEPFVINVDGARSVASSETAIHETLPARDKTSANLSSTAMRLRSLGSRHVLVKDTAFQTWYTLLNYLYTGKFELLSLSSAAPGGQPNVSSTSALDGPKCSAKSMYRLACKVGLDHLRNEALSQIQQDLSEQNILKELSCSLLSRHPELLEMELDVLYTHIASPFVVAGFPALAERIALKELPHGADIIIGIHARMLKERRPPSPILTEVALAFPSADAASAPLVDSSTQIRIVDDPPSAACEALPAVCKAPPQPAAGVASLLTAACLVPPPPGPSKEVRVTFGGELKPAATSGLGSTFPTSMMFGDPPSNTAPGPSRREQSSLSRGFDERAKKRKGA